MSRFVAFLRGMNLGRRRITNQELCGCFESMGFADVSAFLASGNVLFSTSETDTTKLGAAIESGLAAALDYEVPTFLRSAGEVATIAGAKPFTDAELEGRGKPQVMLLGHEPDRAARRTVLALATDEDRLAFGERELYWLPSAGILDSELDFKPIERALGPSTMRTLRTLERLAAKLA